MEEKKKSARTATAVATAPLFPKLFPPSEPERQLHVDRLEVLRGSRERLSVRRAAGSLALARGIGGGGRCRRRPRPLEAAGGARGGRRAGTSSFLFDLADCLLSSFEVPRGDRSGPLASPVAPQ